MAVESDVERLFAEVRDLVKSERKRFAVLVNNAAQYVFGHVTEVTEEDWDRVLGTNVKGCAQVAAHSCSTACARSPHMGRSQMRIRFLIVFFRRVTRPAVH